MELKIKTNSKCPFCRILRGDDKKMFIKLLWNWFAIKPINKRSIEPFHLVLFPIEHIMQRQLLGGDSALARMEDLNTCAGLLKKHFKLKGFRLVMNFDDYQTVEHAHVHFLSGNKKNVEYGET